MAALCINEEPEPWQSYLRMKFLGTKKGGDHKKQFDAIF